MNSIRPARRSFLALTSACAIGATLLLSGAGHFIPALRAEEKSPTAADPAAALKGEIETIKGQLPSQSHTMADVAYHYCNLYFAAENKNWPLATFYMDETRSHLKWAMRVKPIRKLSSGQNLDVKAILEGLDKTAFAALAEVITAKDSAKFPAQYEATLAACYSCHVAAEKPYLKLKIPTAPAEHLIDFSPSSP